jgi:hypothetical protein
MCCQSARSSGQWDGQRTNQGGLWSVAKVETKPKNTSKESHVVACKDPTCIRKLSLKSMAILMVITCLGRGRSALVSVPLFDRKDDNNQYRCFRAKVRKLAIYTNALGAGELLPRLLVSTVDAGCWTIVDPTKWLCWAVQALPVYGTNSYIYRGFTSH